MGDYGHLYSQSRYWRNEAIRLRNEKKKWKRRKKDVEDVKKALCSIVRDSASDVNSKIVKAHDKLDHSIDCPTKDNMIDLIFRGKNEQGVDSDSDLLSGKEALEREMEICERKITELEDDLENAENQVGWIQDMIRNQDKD